jgi:signal transduction histidine kinase
VRRLLRSIWDEPAPADPPGPFWWDWALVALLVPAAILEGLLRADLPDRAVAVPFVLALVPTLLWRRTRPLLMLAIAFGAGTIVSLAIGHDPNVYTMVFLVLLPFALVRWGSGRAVVVGIALVLLQSALSFALGHMGLGDAVGGFVVLALVWALAMALRYRSSARQRQLEQVRLLERERLARDLHDTIAHHVSAIAIRAQAGLATAATNPTAAADALRLIDAEASRALNEMRTMVRYLRDDQPANGLRSPVTPNPGIAELADLAAPTRGGPSIDVDIVGDVGSVPLAVATTIYRLAQESVTNAHRHARRATRIAVRVVADDRAVHLRVSDDGEPTAGPAAASGFGLVGMAERARLLGGTCEAGPNPDRGWTVAAVLPRTGAAR